ncbi:DegV family protein [Alkaliphilus hydrothermalis]|uniref:DegV family protein with EDD domain n=1 Tax=Alkaliphilus hydrothermalis TaxID=1482730 RepID=A0ABS2NN30_9FIRM|nr:DegV family protein [Alkaliphilus hydrothermalis]MBM7614314.1 DegV family protein with EDD domain [Alkaliphilus hydrothermalis]
MTKIAIVADSTSDLIEEDVKKYNIKILPLRVVYSEEEEYRDRVEITPEEIYARFDKDIPTTSLPSPEDTINLFKQLEDEGYTHVIVTTISSGLSGTMNMIQNVASDFKNLVIEIIDSKALTMGLGFPVLEGAKELQKSNDFVKTVQIIKETIKKTEVYFVVKTLEYLKKGGRIGKVEGTIGELLSIKPIISITEEGIYYTYKKVRGRNKSLQEIYNLVKEKARDKMVNVAVAHGNAYEEAHSLLERIKELKNVKHTVFTQVSPVMVVHTGPGLMGVVISEYTE